MGRVLDRFTAHAAAVVRTVFVPDHRAVAAREESGRERLITPAFLPRNTGIATIVADGSTADAVTLLRLLVH